MAIAAPAAFAALVVITVAAVHLIRSDRRRITGTRLPGPVPAVFPHTGNAGPAAPVRVAHGSAREVRTRRVTNPTAADQDDTSDTGMATTQRE